MQGQTRKPGNIRVEAVLLGVAQDAGIPQVGCVCPRCRRAWHSRDFVRQVTCLGVVDHLESRYWLIDATPDIRSQLADMQRTFQGYELAGVILTHAHAGHYPGLLQFGKEGWDTDGLRVYASGRMLQFLAENQPWASILAANLQPVRLDSGKIQPLSENLGILPVQVPHREEFSDTLAFKLVTTRRKLFYCPDIDSWERFKLDEVLEGVSYALLDGSFYSATELVGRDMSQIPHPTVQETLARVRGLRTRVWLVHLNHSNPLHDPGPERAYVESRGVQIGARGQRWKLL